MISLSDSVLFSDFPFFCMFLLFVCRFIFIRVEGVRFKVIDGKN